MGFPKYLREQRLAKGLTQPELSARSGVPQTTLSRYEQPGASPKIENILKIATALEIPAERFINLMSTDLSSGKNHETLLPVKEADRAKVRRIPDLGWAGAGLRVDPMRDDVSEFVEAVGLPRGEVVSFRVKGNSMAGHLIGDGHRVYVRVSPSPESGEMVVVSIEGQYLIKVFRVKHGKTWLYSSDGVTPPIDMSLWHDEDIEMVGVLVKSEWMASEPRKRK